MQLFLLNLLLIKLSNLCAEQKQPQLCHLVLLLVQIGTKRLWCCNRKVPTSCESKVESKPNQAEAERSKSPTSQLVPVARVIVVGEGWLGVGLF